MMETKNSIFWSSKMFIAHLICYDGMGEACSMHRNNKMHLKS
jgi:hypothetical protein